MSCPICNKEAHARYRPFCSKRCADVDLARWLREDYALPGDDEDVTASQEDNQRPPIKGSIH